MCIRDRFKGDYQGTRFATNAWGIYVEGDKHYLEGSVGIGTTSPDAPLRIDQDSNAVALKVTGGGGGVPIAEFVRDVGADTSVRIHGSSSHSTIQIASVNNTFSLGVNNTTFQICDNDNLIANARLSIDDSGNVGINETNPNTKLHVTTTAIGSATFEASTQAPKPVSYTHLTLPTIYSV